MSEFGGFWKRPNNPACTKNVKVFKMLKLETIGKKKDVVTKHDKEVSDDGVITTDR